MAEYSTDGIRRGWLKVNQVFGPLTKSLYSGWLSPDLELYAVIHEADDELAWIEHVKTGVMIYKHPRTELGERVVLECMRRR